MLGRADVADYSLGYCLGGQVQFLRSVFLYGKEEADMER